jgi:cytochrome bd-type quinol oxidase subunit 1
VEWNGVEGSGFWNALVSQREEERAEASTLYPMLLSRKVRCRRADEEGQGQGQGQGQVHIRRIWHLDYHFRHMMSRLQFGLLTTWVRTFLGLSPDLEEETKQRQKQGDVIVEP